MEFKLKGKIENTFKSKGICIPESVERDYLGCSDRPKTANMLGRHATLCQNFRHTTPHTDTMTPKAPRMGL